MGKNTKVESLSDVEKALNVHPSETDFSGWQTASSIIWRPDTGDILEGVYGGSDPFTEGALDTEVNKHYVVKADGVQYSFVGGAVFDKTIKKAGILSDDLIHIQYLGQTECKAGRVNLFDVKFKPMGRPADTAY